MADHLQYKCPNCGGSLEFSSASQKMRCPFCESEFEMAELQARDAVLDEEPATAKNPDLVWGSMPGTEWAEGETAGMAVYTCQSCSGQIIADQNQGASACPYCGNNVVFTGAFAGALKPDYVIPFQLDKNAAKEGLKSHMKGKRLLPKVFSRENHIDEIKGIYVPFWLFDAASEGEVTYQGTKIRVWSDSDYDYKETEFYSIVRGGSVAFNRIPVDGSTQMPDDLMESIEPFDFGGAVPFQTAYLAGYLADKYDVTAEDSIARTNRRIVQSTEDVFRNSITGGYATVVATDRNIRLGKGEAHYALYPVWLLYTHWKDKDYLFAMNGQTGKFVGDLPADPGAMVKWGGIIGAVTAAVAFAVQFFLLQ